MSEEKLREKLARIDQLREEAAVCKQMYTRWVYLDNEFVLEASSVKLVRRWRSRQVTEFSQKVLSTPERELMRDWMQHRERELLGEVDKLLKELEK